jgi:hypothetical protein
MSLTFGSFKVRRFTCLNTPHHETNYLQSCIIITIYLIFIFSQGARHIAAPASFAEVPGVVSARPDSGEQLGADVHQFRLSAWQPHCDTAEPLQWGRW